jgi:hypothetical protein
MGNFKNKRKYPPKRFEKKPLEGEGLEDVVGLKVKKKEN